MVLTKNKKLKKHRSSVGGTAVPLYNISILGAGSVGKSSLIHRLLLDEFQQQHVPTVSEIYRIPLQREMNTVAHFSVYDTAGSIEFPVMRRLTVSKSDACMIVYSVDSMKSFQIARTLINEMIEVRGESFPCVLVANKSDITPHEVSFETGLRCAVEHGMSYVETSAKDDKSVEQSFHSVLSKIEAVSSLRDVLLRRQSTSPTDQSKRKTSSWNKLKRTSTTNSINVTFPEKSF